MSIKTAVQETKGSLAKGQHAKIYKQLFLDWADKGKKVNNPSPPYVQRTQRISLPE